MSLTAIQALVALAGAALHFVLGVLIGRWTFVLVPVGMLLLYVLLFPDAWYNRIPEDWQATGFTALIGGVALAALGVASSKLGITGRRRDRSDRALSGRAAGR